MAGAAPRLLFCVAGAALGALQAHFVWQVQLLEQIHRGPQKSGDNWVLWTPAAFAWQAQHLEHLAWQVQHLELFRLVLRGWRSMAVSIADFIVCESFVNEFKLMTDHFQEDDLLMLCDIMEICAHGPNCTDEQRTCLYR